MLHSLTTLTPTLALVVDSTSIIGTIVVGLIIGAIAKFLMPGKDPGGCIITILLGIAGAFVGTFLGQALFSNRGYAAGWIMSVLGAMLLLFIYRLIVGKKV